MLGLVSISVSMQLQAGVTEFGAGLDQSVWRLTSDTQVECRLEHPIPNWGTGAFVSRAGRKINLDFELRAAPAGPDPDGQPGHHAAGLAPRHRRA